LVLACIANAAGSINGGTRGSLVEISFLRARIAFSASLPEILWVRSFERVMKSISYCVMLYDPLK
jgi:hypothetical protein